MVENRCYCEECKKIQTIIIKTKMCTKDFNIGTIEYNKLYGICSVCSEEVYSIELSKKNKIEISKKIKELEDEMTIFKIIEDSKLETLNLGEKDKKVIKELENIFKNKDK